ncbi:hypothetical protein [Arenibacter algicola]|uniref:hypothetical protein n=1 Tax=Arenibacter algicola TaxID=616991 RepID=UPI0012FE01F3|nr:hypothetical protein [Arenibacter algicola]|tara:strand:- start:15470 stop:15661 length:192 start_codon:yes stop_codon:yes gene_type:complete
MAAATFLSLLPLDITKDLFISRPGTRTKIIFFLKKKFGQPFPVQSGMLDNEQFSLAWWSLLSL